VVYRWKASRIQACFYGGVAENARSFQEPTVTDENKIKFSDFEQFEPDLFWQEHGRKIIWATVAALAVGLVAYFWQQQRLQEADAASAKLSQAADAAALQQIVQSYPNTDIAAAALIRLADVHYREGRYQEAATAYQQFLEKHPKHLLADAARLGLAAIQEAVGNFDGARSLYTQLASANPNGYAVGAAKLGAARCTELLGQPNEARQAYNEVMASDKAGAWQGEAFFRWTVLGRLTAKPATPQAVATP
jgi:tetratricopeptide (TPR) repeat protein